MTDKTTLLIKEQVDMLFQFPSFIITNSETGAPVSKKLETKVDAANFMYGLIGSKPEKYSTTHDMAELYGFTDEADIEALQTPVSEKDLCLEDLQILSMYQDKIIARVSAENADITSPASVKQALTGCVCERKLIVVAMYAFKKLGKLAKGELAIRLVNPDELFFENKSYKVPVSDLKQALFVWQDFCSKQPTQGYTSGGDEYKGDNVLAIFSWNGRCWNRAIQEMSTTQD